MLRSSVFRSQTSRTAACALCTLYFSAWIACASAGPILIDDFNDGNDDGWTHFDSNVGQPWGPGNFVASSGAYQLTTTGQVPPSAPGGGFVVSFWDQSADSLYSNGFVRAKIRTDTPGTSASIVFRISGDLATGFDGYLFGPAAAEDGLGDFAFVRIEGSETVEQIILEDVVFGLGEDWWVEAGGVGDQISLKVWRDGDPEPDGPQLELTDSTFSAGRFGVEANIYIDLLSQVNATFDDITFTPVPEPSSLLLAGAGVVALLPLRRCRSKRE